jgi:hypothetical protein
MKKVVLLIAIAAVFTACQTDNNKTSGLLGGNSTTVSADSTNVDSVVFESMVQDTLATN